MLMKLMKASSRKQLRLLTVSGRFLLHFNYRWARTKPLIRIAPNFGSTSLSFAVLTSFQCLIFFLFYFSFWFHSRCFNGFILSLWKTGPHEGHEMCCHKSHWGWRGIIWFQDVPVYAGESSHLTWGWEAFLCHLGRQVAVPAAILVAQ